MSDTDSKTRISSGMTVGAAGIFTSRVTGLMRDICFAKYWGTGDGLGAFFIAFTFPNLFRRVFGEGALSEAFIPTFTEKLTKEGKAEAFRFASNVLTIIGIVLVSLVGIGIGTSLLLRQLFTSEISRLTLNILPYLLPYAIFICLAGVMGGMLNSLRHFTVPALSPIILNCALIVAVLFISPRFGPDATSRLSGLAGAVVAAGVLQILVLVPILRKFGFSYKFIPDFRSSHIITLRRLVIPGVLGASVNQINVLCDRLFAGWLGGYAVTSLYYSERLVYLPVGIFAVALAAACLPEFTRAAANKNTEELLAAFFYSLRHIIYLTLPCVLILIVMADSVTALLYERGSFTSESTKHTVSALLFYAPGIPAFAAVKVVRSGFFCVKDMVTPMKVGCGCLVLNVILNVALMIPLEQSGLALATTICSYVNVIILSILLLKSYDVDRRSLSLLAMAILRMAGAASVMAVVIVQLKTKIGFQCDHVFIHRLATCLVPLFGGLVTYMIISLLVGSKEPRELIAALLKRTRS